MTEIKIAGELKAKCRKAALGCVEAEVKTDATPAARDEELRAGETFKGIGKYDLNLESLPLFADARGPHGSATSDSERTMVSDATTRVLAIIVSFGGASALDTPVKRLTELLTLYAEARKIDC